MKFELLQLEVTVKCMRGLQNCEYPLLLLAGFIAG